MPSKPTMKPPGKGYLARRASRRDSDASKRDSEREQAQQQEQEQQAQEQAEWAALTATRAAERAAAESEPARAEAQQQQAQQETDSEEKAATAMQSSTRGYFARRKQRKAIAAQEQAQAQADAEEKAATAMQSRARGYFARRKPSKANAAHGHDLHAARAAISAASHHAVDRIAHAGGHHAGAHRAHHAAAILAHAKYGVAAAASRHMHHLSADERAAVYVQRMLRGQRGRVLARERRFAAHPIEEGRAWLFADLVADVHACGAEDAEPSDETVRRAPPQPRLSQGQARPSLARILCTRTASDLAVSIWPCSRSSLSEPDQ